MCKVLWLVFGGDAGFWEVNLGVCASPNRYDSFMVDVKMLIYPVKQTVQKQAYQYPLYQCGCIARPC